MKIRTPLVSPDPYLRPETRTPLFPFAIAIEREPPPIHRHGTQSNAEIYEASCTAFGITPYDLAKLLGALHPNVYPYRWLSGKHRMGRHYLLRLLILWKTHFADGVNFASILEVDWETGEAVHEEPDPPKGYQGGKPPKATSRCPAADRGRARPSAPTGSGGGSEATTRSHGAADDHPKPSSCWIGSAISWRRSSCKKPTARLPALGEIAQRGWLDTQSRHGPVAFHCPRAAMPSARGWRGEAVRVLPSSSNRSIISWPSAAS